MTDISSAPTVMPAAFFGHGNPMNALEVNRYTAAWRAFGQAVPRPRAILVVSAHWYINATAVTAMPRPRTIHDFYGFPPELFDVQYPAPGLPELAGEIKRHREADVDRGRCRQLGYRPRHLVGARARVPGRVHPRGPAVVNADKDFDYHLELGGKLAPLRERGVLVIASGNVVHNLARWNGPLADDGLRLGAALRRGRQGPDAVRRRPSPGSTATATTACRADAGPLHPAALPGRAGRRCGPGDVDCSSTATPRLAVHDGLHARAHLPPCRRRGGSPQPPADLPADESNI